MQTNVFPRIIKEQKEREIKEQIEAAERRYNSNIKAIESLRIGEPTGMIVIIGLLISFLIGLFVCIGYYVTANEALNAVLSIFILICLFGGIISFALNKSERYSHEDREIEIEDWIANEKAELEEEIELIQYQRMKELKEYVELFEYNAQNMSVLFAEGELTMEVAEWITKGFSRAIDVADRRSHIERIIIPFVFDVYTDKVICNLGSYDFKTHRCRELSGPLEQSALARAVAFAVHLNIRLKYPKDVCGTDIFIAIKYSYTDQYAAVKVTYTALNAKFEAARNWEIEPYKLGGTSV